MPLDPVPICKLPTVRPVNNACGTLYAVALVPPMPIFPVKFKLFNCNVAVVGNDNNTLTPTLIWSDKNCVIAPAEVPVKLPTIDKLPASLKVNDPTVD